MMDLNEIERITNQASEGPWEYHHYGEEVPDEESMYDWFVLAPAIKGHAHNGIEGLPICENASNHKNGRFIVMARNKLPALIERMRKLEAVAEAAKIVMTISDREHGAWKDLRSALKALEK